jgi:hypothetical protein
MISSVLVPSRNPRNSSRNGDKDVQRRKKKDKNPLVDPTERNTRHSAGKMSPGTTNDEEFIAEAGPFNLIEKIIIAPGF